ncbi:MAG TPA: O-antigen ligase family protein, partial [Blastocatellia bacterium]|nr:O-antigen ligase family protein [Blastocatellia bacterium]
MKTAPEIAAARFDVLSSARPAVFWLSLALLVAVPLAFSTAVHRIFSLPKFAILVVGSSALAALIGLIAVSRFANKSLRPLASRHALILCLYMVAVTVSTLFGVAPRVSLFGSFENQMGLITRLCFLICFSGLIVGIGHSQTRLRQTAWAMSVVGLVIATYAFLQFFGQDRLLDPALYTFDSAEGPTVRVMGTLGHANYLGNFLLYTTPLCAALSVVARRSARRIALLAVAVSVAAIVFSGTRGAALGLVAGAATFMALEFRASRISFNRRTVWRAAAAFIIILASILTISFNPASRSIAARALTAIKEGASGAGRTLLWRDSVKMVPDFALIGCGPEGFRKAFLPYKSKEIAELAPGTNDESAHNSYLDAAISYGLPGAIFYAAIIASSLSLLMRARRRALNQSTRIISTGLLASLAAVAVHNIFIFDQIPTGLYFFALAALAQVALGVATAERRDESVFAPKAAEAAPPRFLLRGTGIAVVIAGLAITALAAWYSIALVKADVEINKSFQSASAGDYESTLAHGHAAASSPEMTGAYNFQ